MRLVTSILISGLLAAGVAGVGGAGVAAGQQAGEAEARAGGPGGEHGAREQVRYDGHRSVRVTARTPRQLMTVLALTDDVLTCEGAGIGTFDVRFSPEQFAAFLDAGVEHEVLIEDLQAHIDAWRAENEAIRQQDSGWYDVFRDLVEVEARVDALVAAHPNLATLSVIGESLEGRPIRMVRVTGPGGAPPQARPAMVVNGTQHSRESLSPMTTVYFLEHLLEGYASDPRIEALVDGIDFHIVPMVNPDGYVHVWDVNAMWRKNRRIVSGSSCRGVDLNRNWGYQWGQAGSSNNPCNETYRGTEPLSEPETQAIASVVDDLGAQGRLRAHLDIHSYATKMLSPWGHTTNPPAHLPTMNYLGAAMRDAIASHRGTWYEYGQGSIILYVVSGGSRDHSYGFHGALGWTIELPGTSFHPPASEILPVAEETMLGILTLGEFLLPAVQMFVVDAPTVLTAGMPGQVTVSIDGAAAASERLHWRIGSSGAFTEESPVHSSASYYIAELPALACGETLQYYFSAQAATGGAGATVYYPASGGGAGVLEVMAYEVSIAFEDDFEAQVPGPPYWTVWNHASLTSGAWERVIPIGSLQNGVPAAPFLSAVGERAYVTENGPVGGGPGVADVDGGPTILTSPAFDLSGAAHAELSYHYWHYCVGGTADYLEVDLSADDGANWVNARIYAHGSGWREDAIDLLEFVPATSGVRVRFSVADVPNNSVTESGVDGLVVRVWGCDAEPCYANCDGSTGEPVLTVDDFTCFINEFAGAQALPHEEQVGHYANCDGSTGAPVLTVDDFTCFINAFAQGCP